MTFFILLLFLAALCSYVLGLLNLSLECGIGWVAAYSHLAFAILKFLFPSLNGKNLYNLSLTLISGPLACGKVFERLFEKCLKKQQPAHY